jgi:hypothetical protein
MRHGRLFLLAALAVVILGLPGCAAPVTENRHDALPNNSPGIGGSGFSGGPSPFPS